MESYKSKERKERLQLESLVKNLRSNPVLVENISRIIDSASYLKIELVKSKEFDEAKDYREAEKEFYSNLFQNVYDCVFSNREKISPLIRNSFALHYAQSSDFRDVVKYTNAIRKIRDGVDYLTSPEFQEIIKFYSLVLGEEGTEFNNKMQKSVEELNVIKQKLNGGKNGKQ